MCWKPSSVRSTPSKKFFEVQKFFSESNHGLIDYLVVTNAKFWDGLPGDIRTELEKALAEATVHANGIARKKAEGDRQKIIDSGVTKVISLTKEELAAWRKAMAPVWEKFEDDIGKDVIDAASASNTSG
jgi:C4-dicarboxylate-binding protein DctP